MLNEGQKMDLVKKKVLLRSHECAAYKPQYRGNLISTQYALCNLKYTFYNFDMEWNQLITLINCV